ncbi:DUF2818 family protein [Deefgea piscis]|uniref:DUF2818 family protein n=1 Tax=Deefgea piscis TaxID=2739061 RepID=UPI001C7F02F1|nr:DUF2818 family protein [Deefgea piscis]QZA82519.1 DUF2818 family protein [Deefgea piscis]
MQNFLLIVGLAALAANLPFFSEKLFFFWKIKAGTKSFGWRLLELSVFYALLAGIAYLLESRISSVHSQNWQFYVSTFSLFVVFAWPGFVWRYFWRKPGI